MAGVVATLIGMGCQNHQVGTCGENDGACPGLCGNGVVEKWNGPTLGQLIGLCQTGPTATPGLTPWDLCEPAVDVCPAGSVCEAENFIGAGDGQARCLPYCDTAHHDGVVATCFDLGIEAGETGDVTPVCTSLSAVYEPLDILPTRLGYCSLPPAAL